MSESAEMTIIGLKMQCSGLDCSRDNLGECPDWWDFPATIVKGYLKMESV